MIRRVGHDRSCSRPATRSSAPRSGSSSSRDSCGVGQLGQERPVDRMSRAAVAAAADADAATRTGPHASKHRRSPQGARSRRDQYAVDARRRRRGARPPRLPSARARRRSADAMLVAAQRARRAARAERHAGLARRRRARRASSPAGRAPAGRQAQQLEVLAAGRRELAGSTPSCAATSATPARAAARRGRSRARTPLRRATWRGVGGEAVGEVDHRAWRPRRPARGPRPAAARGAGGAHERVGAAARGRRGSPGPRPRRRAGR